MRSTAGVEDKRLGSFPQVGYGYDLGHPSQNPDEDFGFDGPCTQASRCAGTMGTLEWVRMAIV